MIRRSLAFRRYLALQQRRVYSVTPVVADALDMVDTFARRHSKL